MIKPKVLELNICDWGAITNLWNYHISEIHNLKENFSKDDLLEILLYKSKYLEFRTETNCTYFQDFFLSDLDEILKKLFDFFPESKQNEFEAFETKTIQVNSIREAVEILHQGVEKDTRFFLTTFFEKQEQTKHEYEVFKREIEDKGCFIVKTETDTVRIYTPELALIFTSKELSARNMDTQTETKISGWEYLNTYIEGYKEGEQYFENEFKISPDTLYGENATQSVKDIHQNFFHTKHEGLNKGWEYVKRQYPIILTHNSIRKFGNYSGIVSMVEEQFEKHPKLFENFEKCENSLPPQKDDPKIASKFYALYHWLLIEMGLEKDFERNENDKYTKSRIKAFAKERYPKTGSQGFYRTFIDLDITNNTVIAQSYGVGYKEKIIKISNNNEKVIIHLKNYPN